MVNSSSKFGVGMRQSIVAFIVMLFLILVASNITGQLSFPWEKINNSYKLALAALPGATPTAEQERPATVSQSVYLPFVATSHTQPALLQESTEVGMATDLPAGETVPSPEIPQPTDIDLADETNGSVQPTEVAPIEPPIFLLPTSQPQELTDTLPAGSTEVDSRAGFYFVPKEANYIEDQARSWEDYAGPSLWPDMEVPSPMGILAHPEDQVNVLLLGSDQREDDYGFRTDTIQLLTINPSQGTVKLTAFPRDLYVYIPGYTVERINTAFGWGGFEALANTMEYNFGVKPDNYVLINFRSFVDVIDSLGGITVKVGRDLCDHRDDFGQFCVSQSDYWMSGNTALWYVRSRYTTSDLDRGRRQQEVLEAVFDQLISMDGLVRAPELYAIYKDNVTTDLTFDKMMSFIPLAAHLAETHEIGRYSIGADQVYDWVTYGGAMVLVPIREKVLEVMRQAVSEP